MCFIIILLDIDTERTYITLATGETLTDKKDNTMRSIKISEEVWDELSKEGKFGETPDDVLRRKYGIEDNNYQQINGRTRRGLLPPEGTKCRMKYFGKFYYGVIVKDYIHIDEIGDFTSLSGGSKGITRTERDGWYDWYFILPGDTEWIFANDWRQKYSTE